MMSTINPQGVFAFCFVLKIYLPSYTLIHNNYYYFI